MSINSWSKRSLFTAFTLSLCACHPEPKLVPVDDPVLICMPGEALLTRANPSVMFVIDRSGSMSSAFGSTDRWSALTQGLTATLPSINDTMELGALLFPETGKVAQCSLPTTVALDPYVGNVGPLLKLMNSTSPSGGTPTAEAIDLAASVVDALSSQRTAHALILATDGAPDCNATLNASSCTCLQGATCSSLQCLDDSRTVARIAAQATAGLPTYVIGIQDNTDKVFSAVLDRMAVAGGRAQTGTAHSYYSAASQTELQSALSSIRDQVGSCIFLTNSVPSGNGSISVSLNGNTLAYDASGLTGWQWGRQSNGEIVLQGSACTAAIANRNVALKAVVTCDAAIVQ